MTPRNNAPKDPASAAANTAPLTTHTIDIEQFGRALLFGATLEEKLVHPEAFSLSPSADRAPGSPAIEVPRFPGRPKEICRPGKAEFPALHRLHQPGVRGEVLHFFANHELLAMELMALVLLRFPEAPIEFRNGIVRTIQEEQSHLRLYLSRMKDLGVSFGDLPVSDYFWKSMSGMKSPLEFVVQMSLTFEQANLDFSLFFMKAIQEVGDEQTAAIMERVFREEIGHVKHGLTWFNRWRENAEQETDWDAYLRLLPLPMTPRRAKGLGYCADARRQAGLSEIFIRELGLFTGSKGRPPVVWHYNPHCDREIARGKAGFTASEASSRVSLDLETVPLFLARDQDTVLVEQKPEAEWVESLQDAGFQTPEFARTVRAPKIGGVEPWGWSPESFERFRTLRTRLVSLDGANAGWCAGIFANEDYSLTGIGKLFSKAWSVAFLKQWIAENPESGRKFGPDCLGSVGAVFESYEQARVEIHRLLREGRFAMVKAPYGTSGMQVKKISSPSELEGSSAVPLIGWMKKVIESQGALIVEPYLEKLCDLSIQLEVYDDRIALLGARRFVTGTQNEYRGTYLGKKSSGFSPEQSRFLHAVLDDWKKMITALGERLRAEGYRGPAGVDALIWKRADGRSPSESLQLKPLIELNPRWTMGRVALELEKRLAPGVSGLWAFIPLRELRKKGYEDGEQFASEIRRKYPIQKVHAGAGSRIQSGALFTNDPKRAREVLTVLTVLPNAEIEAFLKESCPSLV
jgi:uncharacterized ferritin-like protein (DUF455 family)